MKTCISKLFAFVFAACAVCISQDAPRSVVAYLPNQTARIQHVELHPAPGAGLAGSLSSLLQAAFHDPEICCDRDSALQHELETFTTSSLQAASEKLKGRHVLQSGRWVTVDVQYVEEPSITPAVLIGDALQNKLVLIEWNSHVYLLKSVTFDETRYNDGGSDYVIRGMVLLDPQSKAKNKEVAFNREKDNWGNIRSILSLSAQKD